MQIDCSAGEFVLIVELAELRVDTHEEYYTASRWKMGWSTCEIWFLTNFAALQLDSQ